MSQLVPFAEDLARAREQARQKRDTPQRELVSKMQADAESLQQATVDVKSRNRARLIQKELQRLADELQLEL
jgi:hypothetical protein